MARSAWRMPGYRVEELLGAGSSGEVWRARVDATGVAVAVKRIWLSDRAQRAAALSEAAMLSALDHPHLMKLHEVRHVDDDAIVLVLDLAAGGSLASLLARRGRLTVGEVDHGHRADRRGAGLRPPRRGRARRRVGRPTSCSPTSACPCSPTSGVARLLGDARTGAHDAGLRRSDGRRGRAADGRRVTCSCSAGWRCTR